jgi:hypothetical protein
LKQNKDIRGRYCDYLFLSYVMLSEATKQFPHHRIATPPERAPAVRNDSFLGLEVRKALWVYSE